MEKLKQAWDVFAAMQRKYIDAEISILKYKNEADSAELLLFKIQEQEKLMREHLLSLLEQRRDVDERIGYLGSERQRLYEIAHKKQKLFLKSREFPVPVTLQALKDTTSTFLNDTSVVTFPKNQYLPAEPSVPSPVKANNCLCEIPFRHRISRKTDSKKTPNLIEAIPTAAADRSCVDDVEDIGTSTSLRNEVNASLEMGNSIQNDDGHDDEEEIPDDDESWPNEREEAEREDRKQTDAEEETKKAAGSCGIVMLTVTANSSLNGLQSRSTKSGNEVIFTKGDPPSLDDICRVRAKIQNWGRGNIYHAITSEDLRPFFTLSCTEAARKMGISISSLHNMCYRNGIEQWPYRASAAMCQDNSQQNRKAIKGPNTEGSCKICKQKDTIRENMLICSVCDEGYHTFCIGLDNMSTDDWHFDNWHCKDCVNYNLLPSAKNGSNDLSTGPSSPDLPQVSGRGKKECPRCEKMLSSGAASCNCGYVVRKRKTRVNNASGIPGKKKCPDCYRIVPCRLAICPDPDCNYVFFHKTKLFKQ